MVIDQSNSPVVGARVLGTIQVNNGTRVGTDRVSTTTAGDGSFKFSGYKGKNLGVNISKVGYALATTHTSFVYSHLWPEAEQHIADPSNPVIFRMWKLQGAEPLASINHHYKLHYTDAPMSFDLLAGTIVASGGDVKLTVNRAPGVISGRNRLDWGVRVEAVGGGLLDSSGQEAVTYAAPDNGYQPSMTFIFSTNAPYKWSGGFNQGFFVVSRNGQVYSKLGLSFDINDASDGFMSITFGGVANTNSSRNWEGTAPAQ
jgi:hypothetical protein